MQQILVLYAKLFDYPGDYFLQDANRLVRMIEKREHNQSILEALVTFENAVENLSTSELQELYTPTFDLSPACSPHVGFHLFGESYKRGSFMAKLKEDYQALGLQEGSEIPDHLSKVLKYGWILSNMKQEQETYEELLTMILLPAVEKMAEAFKGSTNPYKDLMESLSTWLTEHCGSLVH